jgi:hypothetical protein
MTDLSEAVSGPLSGGTCPGGNSGPCFFTLDNRGLWGVTALGEARVVLLSLPGNSPK